MGRFCGRGSVPCLTTAASHDAAMNRERYRGCLLGQALGDALGLSKLADRLHAARGI